MPNYTFNRVLYFNLNYYCNNKCLYCFSHSTQNSRRELAYSKFTQIINDARVSPRDMIILNGGEPSLHTRFYDILEFLAKLPSYPKIVVYTNGVNLKTELVPDSAKLIIPIHGSQKVHNHITQNSDSYLLTLSNIKKLDTSYKNYSLKFIINEMMISENFEINDFILSNKFSPSEIVLARMNTTIKSMRNKFISLNYNALEQFIYQQFDSLLSNYNIKFLDIPFCLLGYPTFETISYDSIPFFFFSDDKSTMKSRPYKKELLIEKHQCSACKYYSFCLLQENSYLTLTHRNNMWHIENE